ncbi:MAG: hypothetical protein ACOYJL_09165 [Tractidigestivibacter sp.]|uniref:hypothetical protein n=1 Tax=Tractidigestivibacter sp. TaxID=2847320 RepID=UPI003D8F82D2
MGVAAAKATDAARSGAAHGDAFSHSEGGELEIAVVLKPGIGMKDVPGVPYVVALGACEGLDSLGVSGVGIGWPADLTSERGLVSSVRTAAGYEDGIFVVASLAFNLSDANEGMPSEQQLASGVCKGILARVDDWAANAAAGRTAAGFLAPVLSDYFDRVLLMGKPVDVVYPNGRVAMKGTLAGIDIWGRATIKNELGGELEISPEQASIRASR